MISKKILGIVTAAVFICNLATSSGIKQNNNLGETTKNNAIYTSSENYDENDTFDLSIANEDKIIKMLKKEGKIPKNATLEQITKIYKEYLTGSSGLNDVGKLDKSKAQKKLDTINQKKLLDSQNKSALVKSKGTEQLSSSEVTPALEESWNGEKKTDKILVLRIEFPDFLHNNIKPGESDMYYSDYTTEHFQNMMFGANGYKGPNGEDLISMKQFYEAQSGGSYSVDGTVTKWYMAKQPAAYYGANNATSHNIRSKTLIREALDAVGADIDINLADFDLTNRETGALTPDGVIDHLVVLHSGMGEEAGGGSLGVNAVWSHRSSIGEYTIPGTQFKANDYTTEPEDGAAGVFAHEYGHDIGLPDEYDTVNSGPGEPVGYWSIMSSGSWVGKIPGTEPSGFSPWAKQYFQASMGGNWQTKVSTVSSDVIGQTGLSYLLDQASTKGVNNNVVKVNLPDKSHLINTPTSGKYSYWSGNINESLGVTSMTLKDSVDLTGKTSATLNFKTWYDIELDWDYASVQVREKGTVDWTPINGNLSSTKGNTEESSAFVVNGITGSSNDLWVDGIFDLSAYAGKIIELKFQYNVDEGTFGRGFNVDDINIIVDGTEVLSDTAEGTVANPIKFTLDNGFTQDTGTNYSLNYYMLEWRNSTGVDAGLAHIARNESFMSYDTGLLVWYVDDFYTDNWTGDHPGEGFLGVVDGDQTPVNWIFDNPLTANITASPNYQLHDATFSLRKSLPMSLDYSNLYGRKAIDNNTFLHPYFNDANNYLNTAMPSVGRNVPKVGLKVYVTAESKDRSSASIRIKR